MFCTKKKSANFEYKRGYISARQYVRQHPEKAMDVGLGDSFDNGWNDGTKAELQRLQQRREG